MRLSVIVSTDYYGFGCHLRSQEQSTNTRTEFQIGCRSNSALLISFSRFASNFDCCFPFLMFMFVINVLSWSVSFSSYFSILLCSSFVLLILLEIGSVPEVLRLSVTNYKCSTLYAHTTQVAASNSFCRCTKKGERNSFARILLPVHVAVVDVIASKEFLSSDVPFACSLLPAPSTAMRFPVISINLSLVGRGKANK